MTTNLECGIQDFVATALQPFSLDDLDRYLRSRHICLSREALRESLLEYAFVFTMENDMFIGRAGVFTGQPFCILPQKYELDNRVLIPGHRCVPFIQPDTNPDTIVFTYDGSPLPKRIIEIELYKLDPYYALFGFEYKTSVIAMDSANKDLHFTAGDINLPPRVKITAVDLGPIFDKTPLHIGSYFIARVTDWLHTAVELQPIAVSRSAGNPLVLDEHAERVLHWYTVFENSLLSVFEKEGPCASIEEQLMYALYYEKDKLFVPDCGSIEKCIRRSKKIDTAMFGVETRLWYKNKKIPAICAWNKIQKGPLHEYLLSLLLSPYYAVYDCVVRDALHRGEFDMQNALERLLPQSLDIDADWRQNVSKFYEMCYEVLAPSYNHFTDGPLAGVRPRIIAIFADFLELAVKIDAATHDELVYESCGLVTFLQMIEQLEQILAAFANDIDELQEYDRSSMLTSIAGIEYTLPDVRDMLLHDIAQLNKNNFTVI